MARSVCLTDMTELLQLAHPGANCSRFVVDDTPSSGTVSYTCAGSGRGRTTVLVQTPRVFQLQTQGIAGGAPFERAYEARRLGACAR